jgi:AcrR family transcriptional regulator
MHNPDRYQSARHKPLQTRGKERVRVILAAALSVFKESGVEGATTNEIAARAGIPIGSLYRYYPDKASIIVVLTDLYVEDITAHFKETVSHPLSLHYSWNELLFVMIDSWVNYSRISGSFAFMYAIRANPYLRALTKPAWMRLRKGFGDALKKRCPDLTDREITVCLQMAIAASELGITTDYEDDVGADLHHEAIEAIAAYLRHICSFHSHSDPVIAQ